MMQVAKPWLAGLALYGLMTGSLLADNHVDEDERESPVAEERAEQSDSMTERRKGSTDLGGRERNEYPSTTLPPGQNPEVPGTGGGLGDPEAEVEQAPDD